MKIIVMDHLPRHKTKRYKTRNESSINGIVIHTTDLYKGTIQELAEFHIGPNHISKDGCPEICYHDIITSSAVCHCVDYKKITWHAAGHNKNNIAVSLHYKCQDEKFNPLPANENMVKMLHTHLSKLCMRYGIRAYNIKGHRELKGTGWIFDRKGSKVLKKVCPGLALNLDKLRTNVTKLIQVKLFSFGFYHGEIDGIWGRRTEIAFLDYLNE